MKNKSIITITLLVLSFLQTEVSAKTSAKSKDPATGTIRIVPPAPKLPRIIITPK